MSEVPPFACRVFQTPWGWVGIAATERGVVRVVLPRTSARRVERDLRGVKGIAPDSRPAASRARIDKILDAAEAQIVEYFEGRRRSFDLPLGALAATEFTRAVWTGCREIPYGQTRSYGWLAARIGRSRAVRAVGGALGANPVPLIVPCHRVVRSDGALGGFGGGLALKRRLLALERVTR